MDTSHTRSTTRRSFARLGAGAIAAGTVPGASLLGSGTANAQAADTAGGVVGSRTVSVRRVSTVAQAIVEQDIFLVRADGTPLAAPAADRIRVSDTEFKGSKIVTRVLSCEPVALPPRSRPGSVYLLIEQTRRLAQTDPRDQRLAAAKAFMATLPATTRFRIGGFSPVPTALRPTTPTTTLGSGFASASESALLIDRLAGDLSGDTLPLYDGVRGALRAMASAPTPDRAMVVLSNGAVSSGDMSISRARRDAMSAAIPTYHIGLATPGSGSDSCTLNDISVPTGGGFIQVSQAASLVPASVGMAKAILGQALVARVRLEVTVSNADNGDGSWSHFLRIDSPAGQVIVRFHGIFRPTAH